MPAIGVFLLMLLWATALRAEPGRQLFRAYDERDGLRNLVVLQMQQTRNGLLWVGTENGLYFYDGFAFQRTKATDGLVDPSITGIAEDSSGALWVTTGDSLVVAERGMDWRLVMRDQDIIGGALQSHPDGGVYARTGESLHLLRIETDGSISSRLISGVVNPGDITADDKQRPLHIDRDGVLWTGCATQICRVARDGTLLRLGEDEGVPADRWLAWHTDHIGRLWVRSRTRLLYKPPGSLRFRALPLPDFAKTNERRSPALGSSSEGHLLTSGATGLAEWDFNGWQHHDTAQGLPAHPIGAILTDNEGSLWLGTLGHGLYRALGFNAWRHWTPEDGLPSGLVWSMRRDTAQRIWVTTEAGPAVIQPHSSRAMAPQPPATGPIGQTFALEPDSSGAMWIAPRDGRLLRYTDPAEEPQSWQTELKVQTMHLQAPNEMLVAARSGVYRFDPMQSEPEIVPLDGGSSIQLPTDFAFSSDGRLLVTAENGLFARQDDQWHEILTDTGESIRDFVAIAPEQGKHIWLGSYGRGLWQVELDGLRARVLKVYSEESLGTSSVLFARFDPRGWLWIGTDVGVSIFDGQAWYRLDRDDGLLWNDCDQNAFFADRDGSVWIGTSSGLSHFLKPQSLAFPPEPKVTLRSLTINNVDLLNHPDRELPWERSGLSFALSTSSFSVERTLQLRYRLLGLEDSWQIADTPVVRYPALPAGSYRLEIQAVNPSRSQTSSITAIDFSILPPWWRTPLVYLLGTTALILLMVVVVQLRMRMLVTRSRELERVVRERTAELEADKIELLRTREALMERATRDALTGLWNRGLILDHLNRAIARIEQARRPLAVVLIDIDNFKTINDSHGHLAGDEVLRVLARRLQHQLINEESLGRYGGEELLLVIPGLDYQLPAPRIEALHAHLCSSPVLIDGKAISVTASFGVAWWVSDLDDADTLLRMADKALYEAKADGRACVRYSRRYPQPPRAVHP